MNTNSLDHAIRMFAGTGDQAHLLDALEEAARLIGDLQARVSVLEGNGPDGLRDEYEAYELDEFDDSERVLFANYDDFPARDDWEDEDE